MYKEQCYSTDNVFPATLLKTTMRQEPTEKLGLENCGIKSCVIRKQMDDTIPDFTSSKS